MPRDNPWAEEDALLTMELQPPDHSNPQPDENYIVGSPSSSMLRVLDTDRIPAPPFLNTPPAVTFLRPTNGAQFTVPAVITLEAEAADADFGITAVEFLAGNTVIGVVTNKFLFESGPTIFRFIWTNIPPGEYRRGGRWSPLRKISSWEGIGHPLSARSESGPTARRRRMSAVLNRANCWTPFTESSGVGCH